MADEDNADLVRGRGRRTAIEDYASEVSKGVSAVSRIVLKSVGWQQWFSVMLRYMLCKAMTGEMRWLGRIMP